jgi:hypothetical protein
MVKFQWFPLKFEPKKHVFQRPKFELRMRVSSKLCNGVVVIKTDSDAKFELVLTSRSKVLVQNVWNFWRCGVKF